jgi:hypothetical protein
MPHKQWNVRPLRGTETDTVGHSAERPERELETLLRLIKEHDLDILSIGGADPVGGGWVSLTLRHDETNADTTTPDDVLAALLDREAYEHHVVEAVEARAGDVPGGLYELVRRISAAGVEISGILRENDEPDGTVMVSFHTSDPERARAALANP